MILFALLFTGLFRTSAATGHIEVWFLYYSDSCSEFWNTNACDPMFAFCLSTPQTGSLTVDNCNYASTGQSSDHFQDTNNINMEHMTDILGHPNPWIVSVNRFLGPQVMLVIKATDKDIFSSDHMHTWGKVLTETIWPSREQAVWQERVMSDNSHTMRFRVRMYCDANYYTPSCDIMCVADNSSTGHYTCEPGTGRKLCLPGWQGTQCTEDIDECALSFCHSGQCTNLPGDYNCSCPDSYTGKNCSIMASPCVSNPCQNGGLCIEHTSEHNFTCSCAEGWEGVTCNTSTEACLSQPCLNNGSCSNSQNGTSYNCTCLYPYSGDVCQVIEPDIWPATNGTSVETVSTSSSTSETTTPSLNNSTSTLDNSTSTLNNSTSTLETSPCPLETSTPTEKFAVENMPTSEHEQRQPASTSIKDARDPEKNQFTTPAKTVAKVEVASHKEKASHFEPWYIAIIVAVLAIALVVVLVVIIKRRRRHFKQHISPPHDTPVSFNGIDVAFDNGIYTEVNRNNAQTERHARELPSVPTAATTPSEDDLFSPTKPTMFVGIDDVGATGKHTPNQSEPKTSPHLRSVSEKAEGNTYADFNSLTDGQKVPQKLGKEEEHHYAGLNEVAGSLPKASETDEYSDVTFNFDPHATPVVKMPPSPYDIPSNNASYYSTPPATSPMLQPEPANPHPTALLRGSEEIEFNYPVLVANLPTSHANQPCQPAMPTSHANTTPTASDSDTDSTDDDVGHLQEDLAKLRQEVKNNM